MRRCKICKQSKFSQNNLGESAYAHAFSSVMAIGSVCPLQGEPVCGLQGYPANKDAQSHGETARQRPVLVAHASHQKIPFTTRADRPIIPRSHSVPSRTVICIMRKQAGTCAAVSSTPAKRRAGVGGSPTIADKKSPGFLDLLAKDAHPSTPCGFLLLVLASACTAWKGEFVFPASPPFSHRLAKTAVNGRRALFALRFTSTGWAAPCGLYATSNAAKGRRTSKTAQMREKPSGASHAQNRNRIFLRLHSSKNKQVEGAPWTKVVSLLAAACPLSLALFS